jgi:hypothetical protein
MSCSGSTYSVCAIFQALEVDHTVDAGEGRAVTLVSMRIELLLCKDIAAILHSQACQSGSVEWNGGKVLI